MDVYNLIFPNMSQEDYPGYNINNWSRDKVNESLEYFKNIEKNEQNEKYCGHNLTTLWMNIDNMIKYTKYKLNDVPDIFVRGMYMELSALKAVNLGLKPIVIDNNIDLISMYLSADVDVQNKIYQIILNNLITTLQKYGVSKV